MSLFFLSLFSPTLVIVHKPLRVLAPGWAAVKFMDLSQLIRLFCATRDTWILLLAAKIWMFLSIQWQRWPHHLYIHLFIMQRMVWLLAAQSVSKVQHRVFNREGGGWRASLHHLSSKCPRQRGGRPAFVVLGHVIFSCKRFHPSPIYPISCLAPAHLCCTLLQPGHCPDDKCGTLLSKVAGKRQSGLE